MNTMTTSSKYNELSKFLSEHSVAKTKKEVTHTRIGSTDHNVYGGSYHIPSEDLETFWKLYYDSIFNKKNKEYLTEKQLEIGPILFDFDFRYDYSVRERQHGIDHIEDMIQLILEELKEFFVFEDNVTFPIYVMEKPHVNRVEEKQITKDGIHIIIGIQTTKAIRVLLRDKIVDKVAGIWELPITNTWSDVIDEGISKGVVNWQMFGSQKPGNECYALTYWTVCEIDTKDNEFMTIKQKLSDFDYSKNIFQLSVQYPLHPTFQVKPTYQNASLSGNKPSRKNKKNITLVLDSDSEESEIGLKNIHDKESLKQAFDIILKSLKPTEYYINEIHEYTQILPEKYYAPGSHLKNRMVAFALKHTDERLFLSWVMLRSKAADFDYSTIPSLYNEWTKHFHSKPNGITKRSIMYWARQDAYDEYEKVKKMTIDYFIEETILTTTEYDFAMVLYYMFKDKYVCSSIINKRWYVFKNHRWELDQGNTLRLAISKEMHSIYQDKIDVYVKENMSLDPSDENQIKIQGKIQKLCELSNKLKKTNDKNNIMKEAMELFYDKDFIKNMDSNKWLMCFTNGVVDFKNKTFRDGYPQDYITKSTGVPFHDFDVYDKGNRESVEQILEFMEQLFPTATLNQYMWDHLASCLIGMKKEHVFNIYRGSGSNGKSILTDLMSQTLGEYKGTVPITLVTEKRNSIGGTSSEVMQLKGVRYAVMQEPSKDAVINEGVMKELTGGDPIQARALYCDSEIFEPQFSLVVCTNALFEIKSNDDGTWRRVKLVDFMSKFISQDEEHTDDTPHVFKKDKGLKEKLVVWAPIFASMLVKIAFETEGEVNDCPEVVDASKKYRQNQDHINGFISEKVVPMSGKFLGKQGLHAEFKEWFQCTYGNRKMPKLTELDEAMTKKYGKRNDKNKWVNVSIRKEELQNDLEELDDC